MQVLYYSPGQEATIFLETVNIDGEREDSLTQPVLTRVVFPDLSLASGFPQDLIKLDTGLYYFKFTLPTSALAVGSYLADVMFTNPATGASNIKGYQLVVSAPYGNYGTTIA